MKTNTQQNPTTLLQLHRNGAGFDTGYDGPIGLKKSAKPVYPKETPVPRDSVELSPASQGPFDSALDVFDSAKKLFDQAQAQGLRRRW